MKSQLLQSLLANNPLITRIYLPSKLDSTMQQSRRLLTDSSATAHHGTLIVTEHQTHGKGRHGRTWNAPPATSILATLIVAQSKLGTSEEIAPLTLLSSAIPVAICLGLKPYTADVRIKYPNDIVIDGRKIGGILLESFNGSILIGFGINCTQTLDQLPPVTRMPASSIYLETGKQIAREEILASILTQVDKIFHLPYFQSAIEQMNSLCETLGHLISIDTGDQILQGIARKIDTQGRLVLETKSGVQLLHNSQIVRTWPSEIT